MGKKDKKMGKTTLGVNDFILYILNKLEPQKSDKIRLNKMAFFLEFAYIFYYGNNLTSARYAAIDNGPVIDGYDAILKTMEKKKMIKIDGYLLRPLESPDCGPSDELESFLDSLIEKYSSLNNSELIGLSHLTDSYKITTSNEKEMGNIINKKLAKLETFFIEDEDSVNLSEDDLPKVDMKKLVEYEC